MKTLFLVFIIFSFNVSAQDDNCIPVEKRFIFFQKVLNWFGASEDQIRSAPCKTTIPPSMNEMKSYIQSRSEGLDNGIVHGVNFKDESPVLIEAFKKFTTARDYIGLWEKPDAQKNIQLEYGINPHCEKVLCAMEKIWGEELAQKILYIHLKHNFNSSELAFDNSDQFTLDEINDVILALEDLPPHLRPLGNNNQRLTHFKRGYTLKAYGDDPVVANAVIMLFDLWNEESPVKRQYTVFHEMAHNISNKLENMDESQKWLSLSQWVKKGDDWSASNKACFISKYGKDSPWEDYAEVISAYRYNAKELKKRCPEKYHFLKENVFQSIEYIDAKFCSMETATPQS
jgi:hypothetical protein